MIHCRAIVLSLLMLSALTGLSGCEDDPLLEGPKNGATGGSYGRLSMPDSNGRYLPAPVHHDGNTAVF
jgi:hypothetical protein